MGKFYNLTKFGNVSSVKVAIYPVYFTGNMADSAAVHRKPRKKYRPARMYLKTLEQSCTFYNIIEHHRRI